MILASPRVDDYFSIQPVYFGKELFLKQLTFNRYTMALTNRCKPVSGDNVYKAISLLPPGPPKLSRENVIYKLVFRFLHV